MKKYKKADLKKLIILVLICIVSSFVGLKNNGLTGDADARVHFVDVGQGDCTLIELPGNKVMLIDAGENGHESDVLNYLDRCGVTKIDYLVATHPHSDHIGGIEEVIENYEIGEIYMPKIASTSWTYENMLDAIDKKGIYINSAYTGKTIFEYDGVKADILSPEKNYQTDNLNNSSVVVRLICGKRVFLFTGDAEKVIEKNILENRNLLCDVLKVGHHGSASSSSEEFIIGTKPQYAVISCGEENEYGHPHSETLELLDEIKAEVLRTDKLGTIVISTDGENINVE